MPPRSRATCVVCKDQVSKYTCSSCKVDYCSVPCYKTHKGVAPPESVPPFRETCASSGTDASTTLTHHTTPAPPDPTSNSPPSTAPLRPLTSIEWPYVPDTTAYPDPLTRDDPKSLQLPQYEAIATSPAIRQLLEDPTLCARLTAIDALRGAERDTALQRALGVDGRLLKNHDTVKAALDEDTRTLRAFAEAVEHAVRGGHDNALGLDWD